MAAEDIGTLVPTKIPGYADAADIQAALRLYHYGDYAFDTAETDATQLVNPSIAYTINSLQDQIDTLDARPSSGGDPATTAPVAGDFTPSGVPNGFIWLDSDGTIGGAPTSATSVFTNSAPTTDLTSGLIWVDKDPTSITVNPFIPQSVISAKGDLVVGTANDTAGILYAGTDGQVLKVNSSTATGLEWGTDNNYLTPTIGLTSIASGATVSTISGVALSSPKESVNVTGTAFGTGTNNIDFMTSGVHFFNSNSTANGTLNFRGNSSITLDSMLAVNGSATFNIIIQNGSTAYYPNAFTIDGTSVTPKWSGGIAPSSGNASAFDLYAFTVIKTATNTFTVFAAGASKFV